MPLAIGYELRGKCDFMGENVLIAAAPPNFVCAPAPGELLAEMAGGAARPKSVDPDQFKPGNDQNEAERLKDRRCSEPNAERSANDGA